MAFTMNHNNLNITDMERSLKFYKDALGLSVVREHAAQDGSFRLVFLGDGKSGWQLELTWLKDHPQAYDLGENEIHVGFMADDYQAAHDLHTSMGCICYENESMGIYFIEDPDGYWLEIVPQRG